MQLINQHKFTKTYRTRAEHARKTVCEETKSRVDVTQTGILVRNGAQWDGMRGDQLKIKKKKTNREEGRDKFKCPGVPREQGCSIHKDFKKP